MKNPYEVLGISKDATKDEIQSAYRQKSKLYHPDRNFGDKESEEKFKEVNQAYESIVNGNQNVPFNIFDEFFSSGFSRPERGRDILSECRIDFLQAAVGCEIEIDFRKNGVCNSCKGTCAAPDGIISCDVCKGQGGVVYRQGNMTIRTTCGHCYGQGKRIDKPCLDCGGDGLTRETEKIKINIPEGIRDGDRIRLTGRGEKKQLSGDGIILVKVNPHPLFKRLDDDLKITMPITFTQAVFGTTMEIPTLTGMHTVTIPQESKGGQEIRFVGMGLINPQTGRRGDYVVTLEIDTTIPESDKLKKHLKKLEGLEEMTETRKFFMDQAKSIDFTTPFRNVSI